MRFRRSQLPESETNGRPDGFAWLDSREVYLDSACQTHAPATGDRRRDGVLHRGQRVRRAGVPLRRGPPGRRAGLAATRAAVLDMLGLSRQPLRVLLHAQHDLRPQSAAASAARGPLSPRRHDAHRAQLGVPPRRWRSRGAPASRVSSSSAPRGWCRSTTTPSSSALSSWSARWTASRHRHRANLADLVARTHRRGGDGVIVDAAQAAPHALAALRGTAADAVCFSGTRCTRPVARCRRRPAATCSARSSLTFVGGGQVARRHANTTSCPPTSPTPGSNPACRRGRRSSGFGAALGGVVRARHGGTPIAQREESLAARLYDGFCRACPHLRVVLEPAADPPSSLGACPSASPRAPPRRVPRKGAHLGAQRPLLRAPLAAGARGAASAPSASSLGAPQHRRRCRLSCASMGHRGPA